jgi:hypothetical protein
MRGKEGLKKKRDGLFVLGWGQGDVVAFLDNHRMPEKKEDIEPIREKVILTISSSLVRARWGTSRTAYGMDMESAVSTWRGPLPQRSSPVSALPSPRN